MAKPTLGRGLGDLLGDNQAGTEPSAPMKPPGVGLQILIDGTQEKEAVEPAAVPTQLPAESDAHVQSEPAQEKRFKVTTRMLAGVALCGADLALLGWAVHHALSNQGALGWRGAVICGGSTVLAALCGCTAARMFAGRS